MKPREPRGHMALRGRLRTRKGSQTPGAEPHVCRFPDWTPLPFFHGGVRLWWSIQTKPSHPPDTLCWQDQGQGARDRDLTLFSHLIQGLGTPTPLHNQQPLGIAWGDLDLPISPGASLSWQQDNTRSMWVKEQEDICWNHILSWMWSSPLLTFTCCRSQVPLFTASFSEKAANERRSRQTLSSH